MTRSDQHPLALSRPRSLCAIPLPARSISTPRCLPRSPAPQARIISGSTTDEHETPLPSGPSVSYPPSRYILSSDRRCDTVPAGSVFREHDRGSFTEIENDILSIKTLHL